jgi:hypothetical protein
MSFCIAVDFEAPGGITPVHGFTQLGAALIDIKQGKVLADFNKYANMTGFTWEERCLKEFWLRPDMKSKYENTIEQCAQSTKNPYEVVDSFILWAKQCMLEHNIEPHEIYLISDNAAFDLGILRCFSRNQDIMYMFGDGIYRETVDVSSFYQGLGVEVNLDASAKKLGLKGLNAGRGEGNQLALPKFDVEHDHDAVNDAKTMGLFWSFFVNNLQ